MKKTKSKVLSIVLCLCMIFPYMTGFSMIADAEETQLKETIVFGDLGLTNATQYLEPFAGKGFTVQFAGGSNDGKYYTVGSGIRVYGNGTMTVTSKGGALTEIEVTYDGSYKPSSADEVVNVGSYAAETGTWTGAAASVTFTRPSGTGHWRIKSVKAKSVEIKTTQLTSGMLDGQSSSAVVTPDITTGFTAVTDTSAIEAWPDAPKDAKTYLFYGFDSTNKYWNVAVFEEGKFKNHTSGIFSVSSTLQLLQSDKIYFTSGDLPAEAAVKTAPQADDLTYSGQALALVSAGVAETGTMQYQLGTNATEEPTGTWADAVPEKTEAGSYFVWYRAYVDDTNISAADCVKAEIAPKAVKVSGITANDKVYDNQTAATLDCSNAAFDGIVEGDTLTVSAAGAFADANAGDDKTVNISGLTLGGESAANYAVSDTGSQTTATADILARAVKVTNVLADNKVYDGTTTANMMTMLADFDNMVEGDDLTVSATGTYADANIGVDKIVTITSLTLGGESASNYVISPVGTQTATTASITAKVVTVSGITAEDKVYDGNTGVTLDCSNAVFDGKAEGDVLTVTAVGTFADANAGENKTVNITNLVLGGESAANYIISPQGTQTATMAAITAKPVTVSGIVASNKVYDKNVNASLNFNNAVFDGIVEGDTLTVSATGTFVDANAGVNKTVNISNLVLGGTSVNNYTLAAEGNQTTATATIFKKNVIVNGITAEDKFYDGTTTATFDTDEASFNGLISGDTLTVSATGDFENEIVGTNKLVRITGLTLGGASADNYAFALTGNQTTSTADIEKRFVIVAADNQTVTIGSEIDTSLAKVISLNFVEGHTLAAATLKSTSTAFATKDGVITVSDAVIKNAETDVTSNYSIIYLDGYLTVTEKDFIVRIEGSNRYETAAAISAKYMASADTVVLASGLNYADALAGVPLATKLNAPLLLTSDKSLHASTLAEIKRLGAKKVIILGGVAAISEAVEKALQAENLETERVFGNSRYGTATAIAEKLNENPTDIFFVYANNYPDALSVSSVAAAKNAPIIYLSTNGKINADTAAYLAKLKEKNCVKNAYVIGGVGVISDNMVNQAAEALGTGTITRIFGNNRFLTCIEINKTFADVFSGESICVATGAAFPDALAGGVFAAQKKIPMILAAGKLSDEQKAYLGTRKAENVYVLGGTGAVSDDLAKQIAGAVKAPN